MAGGSRGRRTYARDNRGRFASTGTARSRPAPKKAATSGPNRLTRDNSGRIVGVGKNGATARGGRLRTGAGNQRATQTARLKRAPLAGVVSRSGKARAVATPRVPSRIANRSAADQAHRDKLAKQWKTVEKPARRAYATALASMSRVATTVPAYPRLTRASKISGHPRFVRENVYDQVGRLMSSPTRGKNKLTPQQRGQIVADAVASARSLKARAAMTTPRRSTRNVRAARPGGTIAKPKGLKPGAIKPKPIPKPKASRGPATSRLRPGELMNAVARPVGTMARPRRGENPFARFAGPKYVEANIQVAEQWAQKRGINTYRYTGPSTQFAQASPGNPHMGFNTAAVDFWAAPKAYSAELRKKGWWSTSSPSAVMIHELGHTRDRAFKARFIAETNSSPGPAKNFNTWKAVVPSQYGGPMGRQKRSRQMQDLARRVSQYATSSPAEFIAETYAGLKTGRRYDFQVMRAYREAMGLSPNPAPRRRSRLRRPKP